MYIMVLCEICVHAAVMCACINQYTTVFIMNYCVHVIASRARNKCNMYVVLPLVHVSLFHSLSRAAVKYEVV